jgi:hypothetical protein
MAQLAVADAENDDALAGGLGVLGLGNAHGHARDAHL